MRQTLYRTYLSQTRSPAFHLVFPVTPSIPAKHLALINSPYLLHPFISTLLQSLYLKGTLIHFSNIQFLFRGTMINELHLFSCS